MSVRPVLGVIGTGHFASYFVKALRRGGHDGRVVLSPRNAGYAEALRHEHGCEIASSNAEVAAAAEVLLLSVRPAQVDAALAEFALRPGQVLLSALAGVPRDDLRRRVPESVAVVRCMPASFIEAGDAVFPLFPTAPAVERLLEGLGRVAVLDREADFEQVTLLACAYAWHYAHMARLAEWFVARGLPADLARELVVRTVRGATTYALEHPELPLDDILANIAKEGTFTRTGLDALEAAEPYEPWARALAAVEQRLEEAASGRSA